MATSGGGGCGTRRNRGQDAISGSRSDGEQGSAPPAREERGRGDGEPELSVGFWGGISLGLSGLGSK